MAEQAINSIENEGADQQDLREIISALGIEGASNEQLTQLEFFLGENPENAEEILTTAVDALASTPSEKPVPPPNPLKVPEKSLERDILETGHTVAKTLKIDVKDEELFDYYNVAKRFAGKGEYAGLSPMDVFTQLLMKMFSQTERTSRDIFKSQPLPPEQSA